MRNRIDKLGVSEPEIRKQGSNQIVDRSSPASTNPAQAAEIIGKTAQLEFFDLEADLAGAVDRLAGASRSRADEPLRPARRAAGEGQDRQPTAFYVFDKNGKLVAGPVQTREAAQQDLARIVAAAKSAPAPGCPGKKPAASRR